MYPTKASLLFILTTLATFFQSALAVTGDATWFQPGLGACGLNNGPNDFIAALNPADFGGRSACGRQVQVNFQGRIVGVTVVDLCPGCGPGGIDLSPIAFSQLASLDAGRIQVTWNFV